MKRAKEYLKNKIRGDGQNTILDNDMLRFLIMESNHKTLEDVKELVDDKIPRNWLDPLLTGDTKVIGDKISCQDVERLLIAIRERILTELEKLKL